MLSSSSTQTGENRFKFTKKCRTSKAKYSVSHKNNCQLFDYFSHYIVAFLLCNVLQKSLWFAFCRQVENHLSHWGSWSFFFFFLKEKRQIGGWNPFCFIRSGISASSFGSPEDSKTVQTSSPGRPGVRPTSRPLYLVIYHHSSFEDYIPGREALIASGWFPATRENENKSADGSSSTLWQLGRDSVTNPFSLKCLRMRVHKCLGETLSDESGTILQTMH